MTIRFRVISDLHAEFYEKNDLEKKLCQKLGINPNGPESAKRKKEEILLVVGDVGVAQPECFLDTCKKSCRISNDTCFRAIALEYRSMLQFLAKHWNHILLIPGNHEYYGRNPHNQSLSDIDRMIQKECQKVGIHFLQRSDFVLKTEGPKGLTILFLGCTLWTEISRESYQGMNDKLQAILNREELLQQHYEDRDFLEEWSHKDLSSFDKVVILTHHLPMRCISHPRFLRKEYQYIASGYSSTSYELEEIVKRFGTKSSQAPKVLWVCGHTHEHVHKQIHGVEFYLNPFGYPKEKRVTKVQDGILTI